MCIADLYAANASIRVQFRTPLPPHPPINHTRPSAPPTTPSPSPPSPARTTSSSTSRPDGFLSLFDVQKPGITKDDIRAPGVETGVGERLKGLWGMVGAGGGGVGFGVGGHGVGGCGGREGGGGGSRGGRDCGV